MTEVNTLIVSKGHPFDHDGFLAMFDAMPDVTATLVQQPAAQVLLQPDNVREYDAVLFYDMSGIPGIGSRHDGAEGGGLPPTGYRASIEALVAGGTGIVLLNHATVSWPLWPLWRQISGTSFMLQGGELHGQRVPGSGYRGGHGPLPNPTVQLLPQDSHPVLEGLEQGFTITDEIYLKTDAFEAGVVPLLRGDYPFVMDNFTAPPLASEAERRNWSHPPGSNLLVWANSCDASPVVASDLGDGPEAFANTDFRRLVSNALCWTGSAEARAWARQRAASRSRPHG